MDTKIKDKRLIKKRYWKFIIPALVLLIISTALIFRDSSRAYRVEKERLTIEEVKQGPFEDYIQIVGHVEPISVIFMDAVVGGIVEEILVEEGGMVKKGDVILKLTNTNLSLEILNSEAQLAEKANLLRETRINMEQQKLNLQRELLNLENDLIQKKRTFEQYRELVEEELIAREDFRRAEEDFKLAMKQKNLTMERNRQDSIFRKSQVETITLNLENMQRNLELIYRQQDNLNVKAPFDGQLGMLNAQLGESISAGQRIGQVNVLTSYKIKARIDEHYIDRVRNELKASFVRQADTFHLEVKKVYPAVRDGQFEVDLVFTGNLPDNIRTGQSYNISLQMGQTQESLLLAKGGFYQSTGGQWAYVLSEESPTAVKRPIRIGRQNPKYFEVLEGLEAGDRVVTSGYDTFKDNDKLQLE